MKPHITVTSTGMNAAQWAGRCVESVARQTYAACAHVYVANDEPTHDSATIAARGERATVVRSDGRPLLANLLPIWRALPDDEVIVWLDGDDWLATDRALEVVADAYADRLGPGVWLTYGQFIWSDGRLGFADHHVASRARSEAWRATHLKTFRAGLVKRINDADLRQPAGYTVGQGGAHGVPIHTVGDPYVSLAIDQAVMLPMLEMAAERACFIPNVLCVYNDQHSYDANTDEAGREAERQECYRIRRMPRYERLKERPW